ncbi:MAG: Holliday junction resolvase RuvX [Patescibacteria group bacterium]|nr:Holliday junction resolvase RuvX [Patescibacteria group bacterium]
MKILGIDYGDRKIGLATSDINEKLASRFLTLENISSRKTIKEIKNIISKEEIKEIIIGLPVGLKIESEQTQKTRDFIGCLEKEMNITIKKINEVFTSRMAEENLLNAGVKREEMKKIIDQEAARIILQDYLDNRKI